MKKSALFLVPVLILIVGIGYYFSSGKKNDYEDQLLKVGVIPISDAAPLFIALDRGYFGDLKVEPVIMAGGAKIIQAMNSNTLSFGLSNYVSLLLSKEAGLGHSLVAGSSIETNTNPQHALLLKNDRELTPADMAHTTIAVNTRRNINELMLIRFLERHGVASDQVSIVEIPFPRMLGALESGAIDIASNIEPFVTLGLKGGDFKEIEKHFLSVQDPIAIAGWIVSEKFAYKHPDKVQVFQAGIKKAIHDIQENPDIVRTQLLQYTKLKQNDIASVVLPHFDSSIPHDMLGITFSELKKRGWITGDFELTDIYWKSKEQ